MFKSISISAAVVLISCLSMGASTVQLKAFEGTFGLNLSRSSDACYRGLLITLHSENTLVVENIDEKTGYSYGEAYGFKNVDGLPYSGGGVTIKSSYDARALRLKTEIRSENSVVEISMMRNYPGDLLQVSTRAYGGVGFCHYTRIK